MATWGSLSETSVKFMGEFRKLGTKQLQPLEESLTALPRPQDRRGNNTEISPFLSFGIPSDSQSWAQEASSKRPLLILLGRFRSGQDVKAVRNKADQLSHQ